MSAAPPKLVCPLCGFDDDVVAMPAGPDNVWNYTCAAVLGAAHEEPFTWTVTVADHLSGRSGITAELGLYDDLPRCLVPGEPWIEHGVLEHRYKLAHPDVYFNELLPRYGHVAQGPKRYTTSAFIAQALGQLSREGVINWMGGKATGFWSYNSGISYWALPSSSTTEGRTTWTDFARANGLDPNAWDLTPPSAPAEKPTV